jgi:hypothetical protein
MRAEQGNRNPRRSVGLALERQPEAAPSKNLQLPAKVHRALASRSLLAVKLSLLSEKKFPIPMRREFRLNQLIYGAENKT